MSNRLVQRVRASAASTDQGASAVEYAIIVSLIAIVIIAAVILLGDNVNALFERGADCTSSPSATC